ncbi:hypothetical protein Dimus_006673 [Dionaea muscipula]
METLSNSVATMKLPNFNSTPREVLHHHHHHQFNPTSFQPRHQPPPPPPGPPPLLHHLTSPTTSIATKFHLKKPNYPSLFPLSSLPHSSPPLKPPPFAHKSPASGYAAALLDIAQLNGSIASVERDMRKLSKFLRKREIQGFLEDEMIGVEEKGEVMKELVMRKGRLEVEEDLVVGLVNMLVGKGKVGILWEVVSEFERIYDVLSGGSRSVAGRVAQRSSGAMEVKVKLKHPVLI